MSLSNPSLQNPATKFLSWCSQTNEEKKLKAGTFYYFDKESKKNVTIELPMYFLVLDQLSTIKGYHEGSNSGIYSNEVKFLSTEPLNVRSFEKKGGVKIVGIYKDIANDIKAIGGKFTKSVYAVLIGQEQNEVVTFQLKGAAFAAWLEAAINTDACPGVKVTTFTEEKKGANKYLAPVFEKLVVGQQRTEIWQFAHKADQQLQAFIKSRKDNSDLGVEKEVPEVASEWATDESDDLPY